MACQEQAQLGAKLYSIGFNALAEDDDAARREYRDQPRHLKTVFRIWPRAAQLSTHGKGIDHGEHPSILPSPRSPEPIPTWDATQAACPIAQTTRDGVTLDKACLEVG